MIFSFSYVSVVQEHIIKSELVILLLTLPAALIITTIAIIPIRLHMSFPIVTVLTKEDQIFSEANMF